MSYIGTKSVTKKQLPSDVYDELFNINKDNSTKMFVTANGEPMSGTLREKLIDYYAYALLNNSLGDIIGENIPSFRTLKGDNNNFVVLMKKYPVPDDVLNLAFENMGYKTINEILDSIHKEKRIANIKLINKNDADKNKQEIINKLKLEKIPIEKKKKPGVEYSQ